jgi:alpha-galactosidase
MEAWVTDMGPDYLPLEFRMHVSMVGALGIGGHLIHWGKEKRDQAAYWIARYKEIRPIIQFGDLYRLRSAQQNPFSALQYVSKDKKEAVLFAFCTHQPLIPQIEARPPIYPRGLNPTANYKMDDRDEVRSGLAWMQIGIDIHLQNYQSVIVHFRQVA